MVLSIAVGWHDERLPRRIAHVKDGTEPGSLHEIAARDAARGNAEFERLPSAKSDAIAAAALEVSADQHDDQFPIDVLQTGSGTSRNMNANEVITRLATGRERATVRTMTTTVRAIYENGTLRLPGPLPLPEKAEVTVTIRSDVEAATDSERTTWLKVSKDALTKAWENADDDVFNELRQG